MEIEYSQHQPDEESAHVISMVLMTRPLHQASMIKIIDTLEGSEVHANDEQGRIVIVVEAENNFQLVQRMDNIQSLEHLVSSSLVFHQLG